MKKKNYILWCWRLIYPMIFYLVISIAAQLPFLIMSMKEAAAESGGNSELMLQLLYDKTIEDTLPTMLLMALITIPVFYCLIRLDRKKKEERDGKIIYEKMNLLHYIMVAAFAAAMCIGVNNLIAFSRISELFPGFEMVAQAIYSGGIWMELLVVGIVIPIAEELLFRGLVYNRIKEYTRPVAAIILSGLLFGAYHMNVVQGIYATIIGIAMAYVYEKFHTITAPILFHIAANICSVIISENEKISIIFENNVYAVAATICSVAIAFLLIMKLRKTTLKIQNNR